MTNESEVGTFNDRPRRVVMVSESSLLHPNGVVNSVEKSLMHLEAMGHDALVVAPSPVPKDGHFAGFPVKEVFSAPVPGRKFNYSAPFVPWLRGEMKRYEPDIVHLASPFSLGYYANYLARDLQVPSVAVFQTDIASYARQKEFEILKKFFPGLEDFPEERVAEKAAKKILSRIHRKADITLAPSSVSMDWLIRKAKVDESKVHLWSRGVDTGLFSPDLKETDAVQSLRGQWEPSGAKTIVGYFGRLEDEKEVEKLAVLADSSVQLVIVGDGARRADLEKVLPRGTVFTGLLRGAELANAVAAFDICVHPGSHETFGQTLQEAMASGVPVIAVAKGGPLDIVQHGHNGYLYKKSELQELRQHVLELSSNTNLRRQMGQQAVESVKNNTWESKGNELLAFYDLARRQRLRGFELEATDDSVAA